MLVYGNIKTWLAYNSIEWFNNPFKQYLFYKLYYALYVKEVTVKADLAKIPTKSWFCKDLPNVPDSKEVFVDSFRTDIATKALFICKSVSLQELENLFQDLDNVSKRYNGNLIKSSCIIELDDKKVIMNKNDVMKMNYEDMKNIQTTIKDIHTNPIFIHIDQNKEIVIQSPWK